MEKKYYSTDLSLFITDIKAESREEAQEIMEQFIDKIAPIMEDLLRWEECDWKVVEHVEETSND